MTITSKHTKAQILEAYKDLEARQKARTVTWELVANTAALTAREARLLAIDTYRLGCTARQWVSTVVDELKQPVLRSS